MKRLKSFTMLIVTVVLAVSALNPRPVMAFSEYDQYSSSEEAQIKDAIDAYINLKYEALSTLALQDYSGVISNSPNAKTFLQSELDKLEIELYHAEKNQLRYISYKYFLEYKNFKLDSTSTTAIVSVVEGHDVVFEILDPIVSSLRNLKHEITLVKENNEWRIVSDLYGDYLWRLLKTTGVSKAEILQQIDQSQIHLLRSESSAVQQLTKPILRESILSTYNRSGAVDYAHEWAYDRNTDYYDFSNIGGDCTNFVSQALHERGGISETASGGGIGEPGWYYISVYDRAAAWTDVNYLYDFLIYGHSWTGGPEGVEELTESYMYEGDIIQYDWGGDGDWDHSVIVVDSVEVYSGYYYPSVAAHSDDVDNYPFSSYDYGDVRFLHITGY